jgi:septal ring factor EnvC (AmiA/AmiB activator)
MAPSAILVLALAASGFPGAMATVTQHETAAQLHAVTGQADVAAANPIRKVVTMLKSMQKKVTEEGEKAKKLYDAFMCYCKNAGGDLKASMSAADAKIPQVASDIKESEAELTQTKADLKQAQADRAEAKSAMESATALRDKEAAAFASEKAVFDANVGAVSKAVTAIEKGMTGSFLQTSAAQALRRMVIDKQDMLDSDRRMILAFFDTKQTSDYTPSGGEVTGILKEMQSTMESSLAEATKTEEGAITSYQELMSAKTKEVEALTAAIESKTMRVGDLGVSIVQMKNDLSETEAGLIADKQFLNDMDKSCKTKTSEFNEAVQLRAQELTALAETIKVLSDDDALELFKKTLPSAGASFVQTASGFAAAARGRALRELERAGDAGRPGFDLIAMALRGKTVGFEKVIALIEKMVATLKKEQQDDDDKKEYCSMQFDITDDKKKALERTISDHETIIASATETIATLTDEIASLEAGIKSLDKEVVEATEGRKEENQAFTELMAADSAAKELLIFAQNRLNKFYSPKLYKPPAKVELSAEDKIATSFGATMPPTEAPGGIAGTGIAVLAELSSRAVRDPPPPPPEAMEAYAKKGEEATGVTAMMDLLIKDLDKEMTAAKVEEDNSQKAYEKLMRDSAMKRAQDTTSLSSKTATKADLEADVEASKEEKLSATKSLMATMEYIQALHSECDWLLKYFDVRKEARAGEVDALKNAKAVLSGADYSLLQRPVTFLARRAA